MSWEESEFHAELSWCPECQAPSNSEYAHVRYCDQHAPVADGESDRLLDAPAYIERGEAGGDSNTAVCAFFHRATKEIV